MSKEEKKSTVKEIVKKPVANSLSKQRIEKLFRMFCVHIEDYKTDSYPFPHCEFLSKDFGTKDIHQTCSGCILRDIPWQTKKDGVKDLCYAIWHEGVLNG